MNKLPSLRFLESLNGSETAFKREAIAPFVATVRSPADSMQFVALKWSLGRSGQQNIPLFQMFPATSKPMKIPYHFQTISVGISLMTLALGFSLIGLLSFEPNRRHHHSLQVSTCSVVLRYRQIGRQFQEVAHEAKIRGLRLLRNQAV
jgi:hypothetical protein